MHDCDRYRLSAGAGNAGALSLVPKKPRRYESAQSLVDAHSFFFLYLWIFFFFSLPLPFFLIFIIFFMWCEYLCFLEVMC